MRTQPSKPTRKEQLLRNSLKAGPVARRTRSIALVIFAMAALSASATAQAGAPQGVSLSQQWFRFITPTIPAAGYFTLSNSAAAPEMLVGANSPDCASLMLHQSVTKNGVEQMIMVPKVAVPAHGTLRFAPGGYHLMCMSPAAALRPGQSVPVTLRFAGGETMGVNFPVRGATGK